MKTIAFIVPYFGKLPNYFTVWLSSCRLNPTVDFFVFTDDNTVYNYPDNVHKVSMTFDEVKSRFQKQFDFDIAISRPYKLCDYRPIYGKAFSDFISGYDFWGHCDIDLIWGNIRNFVTDNLLETYERILWLGHCSIYKNNELVNNYYHMLDKKGCIDWKDVYTHEQNYSFDEYAEHNGGGLSLIMERNGISMYKEWVFADLCINLWHFQCSYTENAYYTTEADSFGAFFERNEDGLFLHYRKYGEYRTKEFMYCHFQKRRLKIKPNFKSNETNYMLLPPGNVQIVQTESLNVASYFNSNIKRGLLSFFYDSFKLINYLKRLFRKLLRRTN